eukprot:m.38276 g.38276  ORF g.38276 m.38276 type:complete len:326 (-) comp17881_c0_seq1:64-1041(-)
MRSPSTMHLDGTVGYVTTCVLAAVGGAVVTQYYCAKALEREKRAREAERSGRIAAERQLREDIKVSAHASGYNFKPIGKVKSCYPDRRGTPRQPLLVPSGRAALEVAPHVPAAAFENLAEFSHCWIIFVFDDNTNIHQRVDKPGVTPYKAKIAPPQLGGKRVGLFSTRTPHRPNHIGLSVASIERVDLKHRKIYLQGVDMIDGTGVLDIKPYLPYDVVATNTVPEWVNNNAMYLPRPVMIEPSVEATLRDYVREGSSEWWGKEEADDFLKTIKQVLSLDIRSQLRGRGKATGTNQVYEVCLDRKGLSLSFVTLDTGVHVVAVDIP